MNKMSIKIYIIKYDNLTKNNDFVAHYYYLSYLISNNRNIYTLPKISLKDCE